MQVLLSVLTSITCSRSGPVYGPACTVSNFASTAVSGVAQSLRIQAADQYGNAQTSGSPAFAAAFTPAAGTTWTVVSNNDGSSTLQYRLAAVGSYKMALTLGGSALASSPFSLTVTPGEGPHAFDRMCLLDAED